MRINEYGNLLEKAWAKNRRVLGVGKPGVGKTYVEMAVARRTGREHIATCGPLLSPVKVGGYPRPPSEPDGDATHCLFDGIARAFRATQPTVLSISDLGMAGGETLKAIVDLIQFGRIDDRIMPECVVIVGSTNDVGHGADVQGLIEPLKTRWHTIVNIETNVDDVVRFGLDAGWDIGLMAFLRNAPDAIHDWKPSKSMSIDGSTPRGWEYCSEWLAMGIEDHEVHAGCVGKGRALQMLSYREQMNELPDIDQCLTQPDKAPVPENPSAQWMIAVAMARRMTAANFGQAVKYLNRLPAMFRAFSIRDAFRAEEIRRADKTLPKGWAALSSSRDFVAWAQSSDGKDIMAAAS